MSRPTFYLDLDRTLFRTDEIGAMFQKIGELHTEVDAEHGYAQREEYYVYPFKGQGDDDTYYHDVSAWLRANGLIPDEVYEKLAATELADGRFEYQGVAELVGMLQARGPVRVLTFGEDGYQRAKAALCPSLAGIEVITTTGRKGAWLATHAVPGDWLVDDKIVTGIPHDIRFLQVLHGEDIRASGACSDLSAVLLRISEELTE